MGSVGYRQLCPNARVSSLSPVYNTERSRGKTSWSIAQRGEDGCEKEEATRFFCSFCVVDSKESDGIFILLLFSLGGRGVCGERQGGEEEEEEEPPPTSSLSEERR